ncbi:MAG: hypothetical protein QF918_10695 [Pirellulaceae bacterium]|jgi:hypothetical protein|nr:hypothetical protein [Pirellulaceae bacterium]MDP6557148.1 hypothetical protein [Pirellulaceae bacterium]
MNYTLSFGDIEILDAGQQLECCDTVQTIFFCVDLFGYFDASVCKILLRSGTGLSSGAMVAPIEFCHDLAPVSVWLSFRGSIDAALKQQIIAKRQVESW